MKKILTYLCATLFFLGVALAFILGGAHFWRAGQHGLGLACVGLMCLFWTRLAWVRMASAFVCLGLAGRWVWTCGSFVAMRQAMGQPWLRLMAILLAVAVFTLFIGWLLEQKRARAFASKHRETAKVSCTAFFLIFAGFSCVYAMAPHVLIAERLAPSYGLLQGFFCAVWGAWVAHRLSLPQRNAFRMRIWRLFSIVFFAQLALGLMGYSIFLMSGTLHLPIPGLILAAPLYRGGGYFMLILFGVSLVLVGSAWCSHLCYFGAWDATIAQHAKRKKAPAWLAHTAPIMLGLTLLTALGLRFSGASTEVVFVAALSLGLLCIPASIFMSARYGVDGYCVGVCPLGVVARRLRPLQAWRLVFTDKCSHCQRCVASCTAMAIDLKALEQGMPHSTCTLCRACIEVCKHDGCAVRFAWWPLSSVHADTVLTVMLATLHSLFLGIAMI